MPSGKQTSFQYGEISPLQRYKANDASYANACQKLTNMFVRRTGGVSNRPGTIFDSNVMKLHNEIMSLPGAPNIFAEGEPAPIRSFTVQTETEGQQTITVVRDPSTSDEYNVFISTRPGVSAGVLYFDDPSDLEKLSLTYIKGWFVFTPSGGGRVNFFDSSEPITMAIRDSALATWNAGHVAFTDPIPLSDFTEFSAFFFGVEDFSSTNGGDSGWEGTPTLLRPVSYMITFETQERVERVMGIIQTNLSTFTDGSGGPVPGNIYFPHEPIYNAFGIEFSTTAPYTGVPEGLARINLYRSSHVRPTGGSVAGNYSLVGRAIPQVGDDTVYFYDYGESDPSFGPPVEKTLLATDLPGRAGEFMVEARCAANYQERLIVGVVGSGLLPALKPGDLMASRIGCGPQISRPMVMRNTEAFPFSVPTYDASGVVSILSDKKLIVFTRKGVYLVAGGGEQGIVTPEEINPLRLSDEGCSEIIPAQMVGSIGIYVNRAHTKLMAVVFSGNGGVGVQELTKLSSHLVNSDVCAMETLRSSSGEDQVFLLRRDGSMSVFTVTEEGIAGASEFSFEDGRVLSIFRTTRERVHDDRFSRVGSNYDVLGMYVARNNYITLEYLDERLDEVDSSGAYTDHSLFFGSRLSFDGAKGYRQVQLGATNWWIATAAGENYINMQAPTGWEAGKPIFLYLNVSLDTRTADHIQIQYFYEEEDEDGNVVMDDNGNPVVKSILLAPDWSTVTNGLPFASYVVQAYCNYEIPEQLRDVDGQSLSAAEKNKRKSRWLIATKEWSGVLSGEGLEELYAARDADSSYDYTADALDLTAGTVEVALVADGAVISSPENPEYEHNMKITSDGSASVELDDLPRAVSWGFLGIPYVSTFETLPIESSDNRTLTDANIIVNKVGLALHNTQGCHVGPTKTDIKKMVALVTRNETDLGVSGTLFSGHIAPLIPSEWTEEGRIAVKQSDPAPLSIMAVYPKGISGD